MNAKNSTTLTQARLKELLNYDPDTGLFIRLLPSGPSKPGDIAGYKNLHGYVLISVDGIQYYSHRLAWLYMTGNWPKVEIDHRDMNKANNKFDNLREATLSQNAINKCIQKNNTSGFKGIYWDKSRKKFAAQIKINGKHIHLGRFHTLESAYAAYCEAAKRYHGEFARA